MRQDFECRAQLTEQQASKHKPGLGDCSFISPRAGTSAPHQDSSVNVTCPLTDQHASVNMVPLCKELIQERKGCYTMGHGQQEGLTETLGRGELGWSICSWHRPFVTSYSGGRGTGLRQHCPITTGCKKLFANKHKEKSQRVISPSNLCHVVCYTAMSDRNVVCQPACWQQSQVLHFPVLVLKPVSKE